MVRFRCGFTLIELLVVILIISVLAALLIPAVVHVLRVARQAAAEALATQVVQAVTCYEQATMQVPPGDGNGSRRLVKALLEPGPKKLPYMDLRDDMLSSGTGWRSAPFMPIAGAAVPSGRTPDPASSRWYVPAGACCTSTALRGGGQAAGQCDRRVRRS